MGFLGNLVKAVVSAPATIVKEAVKLPFTIPAAVMEGVAEAMEEVVDKMEGK